MTKRKILCGGTIRAEGSECVRKRTDREQKRQFEESLLIFAGETAPVSLEREEVALDGTMYKEQRPHHPPGYAFNCPVA